jgi:hypothetical protein
MRLPAFCVLLFLDWSVVAQARMTCALRTGSGRPVAGISCRQRTRPVVRYSERMRFARLLLT